MLICLFELEILRGVFIMSSLNAALHCVCLTVPLQRTDTRMEDFVRGRERERT